MHFKPADLQYVLDYQHPDVVYRFGKQFGLPQEECEELFEQVKRWLWLGNQSKCDGFELSIDQTLCVIDEMWHNFVLFTRDYQEFCESRFGYLIHHAPATMAEDEEAGRVRRSMSPEAYLQYLSDKKRKQYEYVYDKLGKEIFVKWYLQYPKKYTPQYLAELQLAACRPQPAEQALPQAA